MARLALIVVDARRPLRLARFWAAALTGHALRLGDPGDAADPEGVTVDGPGPSLLFQRGERPVRAGRLHLDIVGGPRDAEVARLERLGATVRDVHDASHRHARPRGQPLLRPGSAWLTARAAASSAPSTSAPARPSSACGTPSASRLTLGVRLLALDGAGRVFLVRHSYLPGLHLPGGAVDPGESCRAAAVREAAEEGGLVLAGTPALFQVYMNPTGGRHDHVVLYVARGARQDRARPPSLEIVASGFHPADPLPADVTRATRARHRRGARRPAAGGTLVAGQSRAGADANLPLARHCLAQVRRVERVSAEAEGCRAEPRVVIRARLPGGRLSRLPGAGRRARIWVPQIREVKAAAARVTPGAGSEETNRNQHQPASGSGWGGALAGSRARATKSSSCGR